MATGILSQPEAEPSGRGLLQRSCDRCLGKFFALARQIWTRLPDRLRRSRLSVAFAHRLNRLVRTHTIRRQSFATFFLRNRPELEMLRRIVDRMPFNSALKVCVLACSKGAEVYSIAWAIRSARPDLDLTIHAVDISEEIIEFARCGIYSLSEIDAIAGRDNGASRETIRRNTIRDQNASMFERMSSEEFTALFLRDKDRARIRPALQGGIHWICGNAADPCLRSIIGPQDLVFANRFLCHMQPAAAMNCLRNIASLVRPGGFLFVSGIDLDVRTQAARDGGWTPKTELIREIHDGDASVRRGWPVEYWGLEPFDEHRPDSPLRYASVFQIGESASALEEEASAQPVAQ
jgi:chemotaxis methyl-accepting protein methylase